MKKKLKKKILKSISRQLEHTSLKKIKQAAEKRNRRKTPYPFGFEYASWRK
tara:strand:- start:884 stop:1036 length:153 start_codon:yes stop_codon:yes gene_type:complete